MTEREILRKVPSLSNDARNSLYRMMTDITRSFFMFSAAPKLEELQSAGFILLNYFDNKALLDIFDTDPKYFAQNSGMECPLSPRAHISTYKKWIAENSDAMCDSFRKNVYIVTLSADTKVYEKKILTVLEATENTPTVNTPSSPAKEVVLDKVSPIRGKLFVFTGEMEYFHFREEAMRLVEQFGGQTQERVTKKTDYLVLGNIGYPSIEKDHLSGKAKRALELQEQGSDISIISEDDFMEMIEREKKA